MQTVSSTRNASKEYIYPEFIVKDGQNNVATIIRNFRLTAISNRETGGTSWAATFDVENHSWGKEDRGDTTLFIDFVTESGSPVPAPGNRVGITGWRTGCNRGEESHRRGDGTFNMPYDDFIAYAAGIKLSHSAVSGEIGPC